MEVVIYLFQSDKPLQVNHTVGFQNSLWPQPAPKYHEQAGEHAQKPDINKQMEKNKPSKQYAKAQQPSLSQHLCHDTEGVLVTPASDLENKIESMSLVHYSKARLARI